MGDTGEMNVAHPLLPATEDMHRRAKSTALHIEDTTSLIGDMSDKTNKLHPVLASVAEVQPVDSPMAVSTASSSIKAPSHKEDESDASSISNIGRSREPLEQIPTRDSTRPSRAPSPLRRYREPELTITSGPRAGQAAAEWKAEFIPIIRDHTSRMTFAERTDFFDDLIEDDKDRYLPPLAAYYYEHPEHIPERQRTFRAIKKERQGWLENSRIARQQKDVFRNWQWPHPQAPRKESVHCVGPKNEQISGETCECEQCTRQSTTTTTTARFRSRASSILKPFRRRRAATVQESSRPSTTREVVSEKDSAKGSDEIAPRVSQDKSVATTDGESAYSESAAPSVKEMALRPRAQTQLPGRPQSRVDVR